jgi:hypothetical protein
MAENDLPIGGKTDPLNDAPGAARELAKRMSQVAAGFGYDDVVGAAANVLINALRQGCPKRADAERAIDELFGRSKQALLEHYDSVTGRRRSIFPHHQVITPQFFGNKNKF